jgi:hypothetical protein
MPLTRVVSACLLALAFVGAACTPAASPPSAASPQATGGAPAGASGASAAAGAEWEQTLAATPTRHGRSRWMAFMDSVLKR